MVDLLLTFAGFVPLIIGAGWLVDGSASMARKRNISGVIIGLTIVALGTSAPELIVNIIAATEGNSGFSYGNIIGSNIINLLLILGLSAALFPIIVRPSTTWIEIPLCLLSALIILVLSNDALIDNQHESILSRIDGIILIGFFIVFIYYSFFSLKRQDQDSELKIKEMSTRRSVLFIIAGIILLGAGGQTIVYFAERFAIEYGISQRIIGLTILSLGTSLPELTTSLIASFKKNTDISIGNLIGSNIYNVFLILGISSIIHPIQIETGANIDLLINLVATFLVFIFVFTRKGRMIDRREGIFMVLVFIAFLVYILF